MGRSDGAATLREVGGGHKMCLVEVGDAENHSII